MWISFTENSLWLSILFRDESKTDEGNPFNNDKSDSKNGQSDPKKQKARKEDSKEIPKIVKNEKAKDVWDDDQDGIS